jgi:hypothetical protein
MIHVVDIKNPFDLLDGLTHHKLESASSVWDVLGQIGWTSIDHAITITINNEELPLERWDDPIADGAHIGIAPKVQGAITFLVIAIVAIVSVVVALSFTLKPPGAVQGNQADPVFSLKGQTNQVKLNGPIESLFGDVRHWPTQGALAYTKYIDQDAWQFSLLCVGQGEYVEKAMLIEDTPVADFTDVEAVLYGPGETVDLFRDNVETSDEVGTVELFGPNENDYPVPDGWFTVVANSAFTRADILEFDITMPKGLFRQSKKGRIKDANVQVEFEYIEVADDTEATEIGTWAVLQNISKTKRTTTPLRYSFSSPVTPGRYKVRGRRTSVLSRDPQITHTVVWESLRAYLPNVGEYGDVTMMAVKARATANLNDQSKRKFNVRVIRKLPIWSAGSGWSEPTATRNPIWAFCEIFRAEYGARLADKYLHLESLAAVAAQLEIEGKWFDWTYDTAQTVWEAAKLCCTSFRAIPLLDIGRIYVQEDRPKEVVQHLFNNQNIIADSFERDTSLARAEDIDGIIIEYTDYVTWKVETVDCLLPGSEGRNMKTITLAGVTDRDRAFREGMYMLSVKLKQRQQLTFRTGVEGFIATHSDLAKVEFDTVAVDTTYGGSILLVSGDRLSLQLDQEVELTEGDDLLTVRGKDGTPYGPYTVTQGPSSDTVILGTPITEEIAFGNMISDPLFIIGKPVTFGTDCSVTELRPGSDDTVEVTAMVYTPEIYAYDAATAPAKSDSGIPIPAIPLPVVTGIDIAFLATELYTITWNAATSAEYYVIQISSDDLEINDPLKEWQHAGVSPITSFEATILTETAYVRVAGVNTGQGPWATYSQFMEGATRITPAGVCRVTPDGLRRAIRTI